MATKPARVIQPSSLVIHTVPVRRLAQLNPSLAQDVVNALNGVDRSRNRLFQQVLGPVLPRTIKDGWRAS